MLLWRPILKVRRAVPYSPLVHRSIEGEASWPWRNLSLVALSYSHFGGYVCSIDVDEWFREEGSEIYDKLLRRPLFLQLALLAVIILGVLTFWLAFLFILDRSIGLVTVTLGFLIFGGRKTVSSSRWVVFVDFVVASTSAPFRTRAAAVSRSRGYDVRWWAWRQRVWLRNLSRCLLIHDLL